MENQVNKLIKKIEITGKITCKTGLHIGGSYTAMNIGGIDKCVIRNPLDGKPYIPGSSLKGKMRSLLQISTGNIKVLQKSMGGDVWHVGTDDGPDAMLYGNATGNENQRPSRLIVRDGKLINDELLFEKTEIPYTEGKTEVVIDRITSTANPRQVERVPAGAEFELNMVLNIWSGDDEGELMKNLFKSLQLLRDDYLGGNGSRGYGQVSIHIEKIVSKDVENYYGNDNGEPVSDIKKYETMLKKLI